MVLCGICRGPNGPWAAVALAAHPSSFARHAVVAPAAAEPSTRLMPLGRRLDRPSRRGRIGRAAAAIRAPVAGTGLRRSAPPMSGPVSCSTGILWCWRPSRGGGVARRRTPAFGWRHGVRGEEVGPRLGGALVVGHTDASAERAEALGLLEKAARHPVARATRYVPPTPRRGRGIRLGGDLGGAHRRKRRRRGACQGRRPAPRRRGGRRPLRRDPGSAQGDRRRLTYANRPAAARRRPRRWYRRTVSGRF